MNYSKHSNQPAYTGDTTTYASPNPLAKPFVRKKTKPYCDCYSEEKGNPGKPLSEAIEVPVTKDGACAHCGYEPFWR